MNDTPRVTVPVEPTEAMLDAWHKAVEAGIFSQTPHPDYMREAYRAMLSAAPATEGGAEAGEWITGDQLHEIMQSFTDRADVSEIASKINAAIALRALPPAREDAQPVHCHHEAYQGYCAHCGVKIVNGFAITPKPHPAPDALRAKGEELVIALKRYGFPVSGAATVNLGAFGSSEAMAVDFTTREFIQALAALQAEQGAK